MVTTFTVGSVVEMGELKLVAVVPDEKLNDGEFELTMVELLEVELSNVVLVGKLNDEGTDEVWKIL